MNTQFHTPSFGDEVFDLGDIGETTSTPTSSIVAGNIINNNSYMYQQQTPQSGAQTKRMISLHNTSDEYHTANEDSFTAANTNLMNISNNGQQQESHAGAGNSSSIMTTPTTTMAARKQMLPMVLNEPAKPLSAYALFFRDTVSAIKQQNPSCTFQELSKIVASMWDALDPVHKIVYNKKNELARNEYINQMRIYRQQLEQQQQQQQTQQAQEQIHEQNSNMNNSGTNTAITSTTQQQQQQVATNTNNSQFQQNPQTSTISTNVTSSSSAPPSDEQMRLLTEAGSVQKCTRESCTKRAIINPDWEDEYCSNECVIIHCRNVFNEWVQSNLVAKQQQQSTTT